MTAFNTVILQRLMLAGHEQAHLRCGCQIHPPLLKEIAPRVNRVAFLFNPATAAFAEFYLNPFKATAASFGVKAIVAPIQGTQYWPVGMFMGSQRW